jgi:Tol biopolymer transport system component/predicted Ser/Thr protein kinase
MPLSVGHKLGPYEILEAIGAGGMGEVYKARDTRLNRIVAIKVSKDQFSERFGREARAVAALNHPHVCQLHDLGPNYLVMEYVDGKPLGGPLPLDQALRYAVQMCDALDHAHRRGVIHRDLKPSNILVTIAGIKLLDFGLAKMQPAPAAGDATRTMALTGQGQILGTLFYMSPEQLQGQEADARSDLFSAGLVLYEMITGKKAFDGKNPASVIAAILQTEPAPLRELQPVAPQSLDRMVRRCLRKDPEQRWQNARDLMLELGSIGVDPAPPAAPARAWLPWTIAAAAILAATAASLLIPRQSATSPRQIVRFTLDTPGLKRVRGPALSPDGARIAFTGDDERGTRRLYLRALDSTRNVLVGVVELSLSGDSVNALAWSPDGRSLLYQGGGGLRRVDLSSGASQFVFEPFGSEPTRGFTWASSGTILFNAGGPTPIQSIPETGGKPLAWPDEGVWPYALPDGRSFLYTTYTAPAGELRAGDLSGRAYRTIAQADGNAIYAAPGYLLFRQGDDLAAQRFDPHKLATDGDPLRVAEKVSFIPINHYGFFSVSQTGVLAYQDGGPNTSSLSWHDRTGQQLSVAGPVSTYWAMDLSRDGSRIAATRFDSRAASQDIWTGDVTDGVVSRFTTSPLDDTYPAWSFDGRWIAYGSGSLEGTNRSAQLCIRESSGGQPEKVIYVSKGGIPRPAWSPDGKLILFNDDLGAILQVRPDHPGEPPQTWLSAGSNSRMPQFSPDGKWVAYASNETGRPEIYVRSFANPSAGKWQISTNEGSQPRWRGDGQELFYVERHKQIMAVGVKAPSDAFTFAKPQALFPVEMGGSDFARFEYAVTLDGKRFLVQSHTPEDERLIRIVLNWDAIFQNRR